VWYGECKGENEGMPFLQVLYTIVGQEGR
jgi:hypothetical protein